VRPELNGKLIILGYFGVCPHVEVKIPQLDRLVSLAFVLSGSLTAGQHEVVLEILEQASDRVVVSTAKQPLTIDAGEGRVNLAPTLPIAFQKPGSYEIRCLVDGFEAFRGAFRVVQS
jgi:hypothetical protein